MATRLEAATDDELVGELARRNHSLILATLTPASQVALYVTGALVSAVGLVELLAARIDAGMEAAVEEMQP
jgi:hypothetical protein